MISNYSEMMKWLASAFFVFLMIAASRSLRLRPLARLFSQKSVGAELATQLKQELEFEQQEPKDDTFITQFKKQGVWQINSQEGSKDVVFKRNFGAEKISVFVSTDALVEETVDEDYEAEEQEEAEPIGVTILIEKGDKGALEIAATADSDAFFIDQVNHFDSCALAADQTSQADWQRRGTYGGPEFNVLDPAIVETFHKYLEERGFNSEFANFIPQYLEQKEESEYKRWLKKVEKFVV